MRPRVLEALGLVVLPLIVAIDVEAQATGEESECERPRGSFCSFDKT